MSKKIISIILVISILSLSVFAAGGEPDPDDPQDVNSGPTYNPLPPAEPSVTVTDTLSGIATIISILTGLTSLQQYVVGSGSTNQNTIYGFLYSIMNNEKALVQGINWFSPTSGTLGQAITQSRTYLQNIYAKIPSSFPNYSSDLSYIKSYIDGIENSLTSIDTHTISNGTSLAYINNNIVSGNTSLSSIASNSNLSYQKLADIKGDTSYLNNISNYLSSISTNSSYLSSIKSNTDNLGSINSSLVAIDTNTDYLHSDIGGLSDDIVDLSDSIGYSSNSTLANAVSSISSKEDSQISLLEDIVDVLANQQDQTIIDNQTTNKNTIIPIFFAPSNTNNTSLNTTDFTNLGGIVRAIRNLLDTGISLAGFSAALDEAADEGLDFFQQSTIDDMYNSNYLGAYSS